MRALQQAQCTLREAPRKMKSRIGWLHEIASGEIYRPRNDMIDTNKKAVRVIGTALKLNMNRINADPRRGTTSPLAWPWSLSPVRRGSRS